jgi:tRNA pseudouridine13 synthase
MDAGAVNSELREALTFRWAELPPLTRAPGTGGQIRSEAQDFQVDEVPLYLPEGKGSHAYALVRKEGLTTRDLVLALVRAGLTEKEVGVAGLKDKYAVTTQWLSVPQRHAGALSALGDLEGVTVLETSRHRNKLGIGHLSGNRFRVRVRGALPGAARHAEAALEELRHLGVPNYFGPQRFGRFGNNAVDGYRLLRGEDVPGGHRLKLFFLSALQSHLFNHLLAARIGAGLFSTVVLGDWAKKHDTGGEFEVKDEAEAARAARFEISATLPLYGKKVRVSSAQAGEMEQAVLARFGLAWSDFARRHGDRRLSRFPLRDAGVTPEPDGYTLHFTLPKGAFATSLLREVMKVDVDDGSDGEGDGAR